MSVFPASVSLNSPYECLAGVMRVTLTSEASPPSGESGMTLSSLMNRPPAERLEPVQRIRGALGEERVFRLAWVEGGEAGRFGVHRQIGVADQLQVVLV